MTQQYSLDTIQSIMPSFWDVAKAKNVWALHGEMGAGKTTFITALGKFLNFDGDMSSPTFSLINQYNFVLEGNSFTFYHCDLYRLNDEEEAFNAGVEDVLNAANAFVAVEWAERIPHLLPKNALHIYITQLPNGDRAIRF